MMTNKHPQKLHKRQQGLTLIEIMVAVTISLFLMGGVIQIFMGSKQTYRLQDAAARVQESGRFAINFLVKDIRMADFWGCQGNFPNVNNHLNNSASNPFDLSEGGISGTDSGDDTVPDTLNLFGGVSSGIGINATNVNAASFQLTTVNHGLADFDYILATDCETADLLEVTNANSGSTLTVVGNTGAVGSGPGNATGPGFAYSADGGARMYTFQGTTYSVAAGSSGEPSLFRTINGGTPQELVEGVENMQILYGEDTDNDDAANIYVDAGSVTNMNRVMSIRVTLTIRSVEDNVVATQNSGDYRLRRTFSTTTTVRNRVS